MESKSLDQWKNELDTLGKAHWLIFYREFMGQDATRPMLLYRAINLYGTWPVLEAILDSSNRELTGDKINYVVKVAYEKWKSKQQEIAANDEYSAAIKRAQEITAAKNADLAARAAGRKPKRKYTKKVKLG